MCAGAVTINESPTNADAPSPSTAATMVRQALGFRLTRRYSRRRSKREGRTDDRWKSCDRDVLVGVSNITTITFYLA